MTYEALVAKLREEYGKNDASNIKEHVAIQFNVTGEAEGALYLEIKDGTIAIEPYEYFDRDILVTVAEEDLVALSEGKLDIVDAYGSGKIQAEGNLGKALLLKDMVSAPDKKKSVAGTVKGAVAVAKAVAKASKAKKK